MKPFEEDGNVIKYNFQQSCGRSLEVQVSLRVLYADSGVALFRVVYESGGKKFMKDDHFLIPLGTCG